MLGWLLRRFARDERANVALLFAAVLPMLAVASAFAIDEISLYQERRLAQSAVDLAAISAATDPANARDVAVQVLADHGLVDGSLDVELLEDVENSTWLEVRSGRYSPDASLTPPSRFTAGSGPINAVRVVFRSKGTLFFALPWSNVPDIKVAALASADPQVAFSVGSRLASLNGGIANTVLNNLLGSSVALDVMSYNGLANAKVELFDFLDALSQELSLSAVTYDDILSASADHGEIAAALAAVLTGADKTAAQVLAASLGGNGSVLLSKLFDLGSYADVELGTVPSGLVTRISALELLAVSAALSDGNHQVALNLTAGVPGLVGISAALAVGEPLQYSWYAIGPNGAIVRTAQTRLRLVATLGGSPVLLGAAVRVPLYLELAYAEARVKSAVCPGPDQQHGSAVIDTLPGVARLTLGEVGDPAFGNFTAPPTIGAATLLRVPLVLKVSGTAAVVAGSVTPVALSFSPADILAERVKTADTTTLTQSIAASLMDNLQLKVEILGLGLGLSPKGVIEAAVRTLLQPLTPVLDTTITALLDVLGLSIGEADVQVYGVRCTRPVLVG